MAVGDTTPAGAEDGCEAGAVRIESSVRYRDVRPGDLLGRYELLEEIGAGGMAVVYRARDTQLRRAVAVKVLHSHLARRRELVVRFQREARAAAKLDHPGVVRVLDVGGGERPTGPNDEPPYMVLDLIVGTSLDELVRVHAPLLGEIVAAIGVVIADALSHAHAAGIVHRDIKPANMLVSSDGRLLLADFGVARLDDDEASVATRTGALLGTPSFMSPEQAGGQRVDLRSDLYSLGATLYQLATGAIPYGGNTAKVIASIATGDRLGVERRNPAVGVDLARIIEQSMALNVDERPQTSAELAAALGGVLRDADIADARELVAGFIAAPAQTQQRLKTKVLASTLTQARVALRDRAQPRAMALASRAFALDPTNVEAQELIEDLGRRRNVRRRFVALGVVAAVAAAGAVVTMGIAAGNRSVSGSAVSGSAPGGLHLDGGVHDGGGQTDEQSPNSQLSALIGTVDAGLNESDAAVVAVTAVRPVVSNRTRADASVSTAVGSAMRRPVDAGVATTPDAGETAFHGDAATRAATATFRVSADSWCNLSLDGAELGRLDGKRSYTATPGRHTVACGQGAGLAIWSTSVSLVAGQEQRLVAQLLSPVKVTLEIASADSIVVDGAAVRDGQVLSLAPGRYRVEIKRSGDPARSAWVSVPRVSSCTLRDRPNLDCYR